MEYDNRPSPGDPGHTGKRPRSRGWRGAEKTTNKGGTMRRYGFEYSWLDDYDGDVSECDVEHVMSKIKDGYVEGELCTLENDGNTEHRGWWKIIK